MRGRDFILATLWILAPSAQRPPTSYSSSARCAIATAPYESCGAATPACRAAVFPQTERAVLRILKEDCRTRPL
jgi:hypothetical protein